MKYSHTRIDVGQPRSETNQTYRHLLPVVAVWADGNKYNQIGFQLAWWKWSVNVFFKTRQ